MAKAVNNLISVFGFVRCGRAYCIKSKLHYVCVTENKLKQLKKQVVEEYCISLSI